MSTKTQTITAATAPEENKETVAELLQRLERTYVERARVLVDQKDQLTKVQDQVLASQDAAFKAYQAFTNAKEQYLVGVISNQNAQLQKLAPAPTPAPTAKPLPTVVEEPREDNVAEPTVAEPDTTASTTDSKEVTDDPLVG